MIDRDEIHIRTTSAMWWDAHIWSTPWNAAATCRHALYTCSCKATDMSVPGRQRRADMWKHFTFNVNEDKTVHIPCRACITGKNTAEVFHFNICELNFWLKEWGISYKSCYKQCIFLIQGEFEMFFCEKARPYSCFFHLTLGIICIFEINWLACTELWPQPHLTPFKCTETPTESQTSSHNISSPQWYCCLWMWANPCSQVSTSGRETYTRTTEAVMQQILWHFGIYALPSWWELDEKITITELYMCNLSQQQVS